ncbi:MAG TPA: hypothetical protein PLQ56_06605 [Aggregatilineales bacterium]|nr:hypothetical protein [Aggregatilineales bacterium]
MAQKRFHSQSIGSIASEPIKLMNYKRIKFMLPCILAHLDECWAISRFSADTLFYIKFNQLAALGRYP